jgi:hypothetical protein
MNAPALIALADAERRLNDNILPLFEPVVTGEPYPVDRLGKLLGGAASAIASKIRVPGSIAGQSVLAVASLAAQARANVLLPYGQTRPLSLYMITVAGSGDRKSSAETRPYGPSANERRRFVRPMRRSIRNGE